MDGAAGQVSLKLLGCEEGGAVLVANKVEGYRLSHVRVECDHTKEGGGRDGGRGGGERTCLPGVGVGPGLTLVTSIFPSFAQPHRRRVAAWIPVFEAQQRQAGRAGPLQPHSVEWNDESRSLKHIFTGIMF